MKHILIKIFLIIIILDLVNSNIQPCFSQTISKKQQYKIDSLSAIINNPNSHDTSLAVAYVNLSEIIYLTNPDTMLPLCNKTRAIAERVLANNPPLSIKQSLLKSLGLALNNIGYVYSYQGNITKALRYYNKSLKIREEIGDKRGIAESLNNIGNIYDNQGDISQALGYYYKSLKIQKEIGDKEGIANSLNNFGSIYYNQGDISQALGYYHKSLKIREEIGDKSGIALSLNNIGSIYDNQGDISQALGYYHKSLKIQEEIGDKRDIAISLSNIGRIYYKQGKLIKAKKYALRSMNIVKEIGYPKNIKISAKLLSQIYEKENKGMQALGMYKLYITMRDSIINEANDKAIAKQEAKYEYEKQKVIDDAAHDKKILLEQEEKAKYQIINYAIGGGLLLITLFLFFVFNRLRITSKQKKEIEEQKGIVEKAHFKLEEKNTEITDSITYAKRIQSAILPPDNLLKEHLPDSFILYKPKDIVAGDFYWLEASTSLSPTTNKNLILFAVADCTGHGVPGAMVSVICNNGLNRSVREYGISNPAKILNKTREIVIQEFEKSEEEIKDGMDIALCTLEGNKLSYSGANNPLWIIRKGEIKETKVDLSAGTSTKKHITYHQEHDLSLIEVKADKQPIGKFFAETSFTTHTIYLQKGDSIYIFSDGYVDQFGGEKGKKFKPKAFRELLLSIQKETMDKQKLLLDIAFEKWRGNIEQVDDVCVLGIRI